MKIRIIVRFDDHERQFFVACGTGEKTFKWLGNVASQRYAMAIPNGNLRRREDYCGLSDAAQFQTFNIILPSGHTPSPLELLTEHLHDEDTVVVELCSKLSVDPKTGTPKQTQFATLAYSMSSSKVGLDGADELDGGAGIGGDEISRTQSSELYSKSAGSKTPLSSPTGKMSGGTTVIETPSQQLAKANFIRIVLKSQALNEKKIADELQKSWQIITSVMKLIRSTDIPHIQQTFFHHWDLLIDIFEFYSSNNPNHHSNVSLNPHAMIASLSFATRYYDAITTSYYLEKHDFMNLIEDANIFPAIQLQTQVNLIFQKTCQLLTAYSQTHHFTQQNVNAINFTGFLIALLLCSQLKYNDTLDAKLLTQLTHSYDSIDRLILTNFVTLAKHLNCRALLKKGFLSVSVLSKVKDNYEILQTNFDKIVSKTKDVALTLTMDDFQELLYNSSLLLKKDDNDFVKLLLLEIRKGTIYGREIDNVASESMKNLILQLQEKQSQYHYYDHKDPKNQNNNNASNELYPTSEFTFPEFIEGIARAGYYYYTKTTPLNPIITQSIVNLTTGTLIDDPREISKIDIEEYLARGIQDVSDFLTGKKLKPQQGGAKKGKKAAGTTTTTAAEAK